MQLLPMCETCEKRLLEFLMELDNFIINKILEEQKQEEETKAID